MKKLIKRYGFTLVISFSKEEQKVHKISEGDIMEILSFKIHKKEREVKENEH